MKLTKAQKHCLATLLDGKEHHFPDESVVKALARKGMAERIVPKFLGVTYKHAWIITSLGSMYAIASKKKEYVE